MQSDTKPLPAQTLLALADRMAECICVFYSTIQAVEARDAYRAARAASPVTLEEHLLAEERRTEIESIKACDVDDNPDLVAIVTAADDARNARKQHARRLAGEGGA